MKMWTRIIGTGLAGLAATAALADDFFLPGANPMDYNQIQRSLTSSQIDNAALRSVVRKQYGTRSASGSAMAGRSGGTQFPSQLVGGSLAVPTNAIRPATFPFNPSAALQQQVKQEFADRLRQTDPKNADMFVAQVSRVDVDRIYAGITQPFGLSPNDAGDVMTAYLVLGWLIANGAPDPSGASVKAARLQAGTLLAKGGPIADTGSRAKVAEEVKILFLLLHSGWQSARKEGSLQQYADGVSRMFQEKGGQQLRQIRLTNAGFQQLR